MIDDRDTRAFLEFARPPAGMRLSYCIGTSFTLDFTALVALALATHGETKAEGEFGDDQDHDIFTILHNFVSRSVVFCQACRISEIPRAFFSAKKTPRQRLLGLLDTAIRVVNTSEALGTFHPKVWLLRFDSIDCRGVSVWKLLVTSRNLSRANTWEIGAEMIGTHISRKRSSGNNGALIGFLKSLPAASRRDPDSQKLVQQAIQDLSAVEFELPDRFKEWAFITKNGKGNALAIVDSHLYRKVIAISPFLADKALAQLAQIPQSILITDIKDVRFVKNYPDLQKNTYRFELDTLKLHAKMYLCLRRDGRGTDVFLGSANLTGAAMHRDGKNSEAMLKLQARADLVTDFEGRFIFSDRRKRSLYPWLSPINDGDLRESERLLEDDRKRKDLEDLRASLSEGTFVLKRYSRSKWVIRWRGPSFDWKPNVTGTVELMDGQALYDLRQVVERGMHVGMLVGTPSSLLWIKLAKKNTPGVDFGSVADVVGCSRQRGEDLLSQITATTGLAEMLRSILPETTTKNRAGSSGEADKASKQKKRKSHASAQIDGYVEALLLADLDNRYQRDLITETLRSYERSGIAEATTILKFWERLQLALNEVGTSARN